MTLPSSAIAEFENAAFSEWVAVKKQHLCLIPQDIDDAAAGLPVAYLTALIALRGAGFEPGKTVFAPAIGGSAGNAVTQAARALGAKHAISSTTSHAKAAEAKKLGFSDVVDLSGEVLAEATQEFEQHGAAELIYLVGLLPGLRHVERIRCPGAGVNGLSSLAATADRAEVHLAGPSTGHPNMMR